MNGVNSKPFTEKNAPERSRTLQNTIGSANMDTISVALLLEEIEKAAVEKQSDLLNRIMDHGCQTGT
jgi:hypothetical protein